MGRLPIHAMQQRKPPILDHFIQASIDGGRDEAGHYKELIYAGVEDQDRAVEIRRALFRSAKHLKVALKADVETVAGVHQIRYRAIDKAVARAYVTQKAKGDPSQLDYNPYVR